MAVKIAIRNVRMLITGDVPKDLRDEIQSVMSYVMPGYKYTPRYQRDVYAARREGRDPWDGTITVARVSTAKKGGTGGLIAPTGLFSYLKEILVDRGIEFEVVDERPEPVFTPGYSLATTLPDGRPFALRTYQGSAVSVGVKKQRGIFKASTGSGKTACAAAMIVEASVFPAVFYVPTCDLLIQAQKSFSELILKDGKPAKIGMIGDGRCDIQDITVATVQSCQRALTGVFTKFDEDSSDDKTTFDDEQKKGIKALVERAQLVIVDECQHVAAETIQTVMNNSHLARFRFGMSASPWRDDGLDIMIEAAFGRRFCDIDASSLIREGFLVKPLITFNHFNQALGVTATYNAHYTKYVVENDARNKWIAQRALFHIGLGRATIVLVKWVKHAERLAKLIPGAEILTASGSSKKSPEKRDKILDRMRSGELKCIIGTTLLDEGVDVPCATVGIFAGGGKSSTRALQRVGRFIRRDDSDPTKSVAYIEEFYDHTKWLRNHAMARRRILETEPEFEIGDNRATMSL